MEFQFNLPFLGFNLFEGSYCPVFDKVLTSSPLLMLESFLYASKKCPFIGVNIMQKRG